MIQLDFRSWTKNPTPTASLVRNPTLLKNLRLRNPELYSTLKFILKSLYMNHSLVFKQVIQFSKNTPFYLDFCY